METTLCLVLPLVLLISFVPRAPESNQDAGNKIDAIFKPLVLPDSPGFAFGVMRDGKLVFARGYGLADLDTKIPITPETDFRLASVS